MPGEQLGYLMEKLMQQGALDVYFTNILMKKNRPAVLLSLLCAEDKKEYFSKLLLQDTSTFGLRYTLMERDILDRTFIELATSYGIIKIKLGYLDGQLIKYAPEYEDCKKAAELSGRPLQHIYTEAMRRCAAELERLDSVNSDY